MTSKSARSRRVSKFTAKTHCTLLWRSAMGLVTAELTAGPVRVSRKIWNDGSVKIGQRMPARLYTANLTLAREQLSSTEFLLKVCHGLRRSSKKGASSSGVRKSRSRLFPSRSAFSATTVRLSFFQRIHRKEETTSRVKLMSLAMETHRRRVALWTFCYYFCFLFHSSFGEYIQTSLRELDRPASQRDSSKVQIAAAPMAHTHRWALPTEQLLAQQLLPGQRQLYSMFALPGDYVSITVHPRRGLPVWNVTHLDTKVRRNWER